MSQKSWYRAAALFFACGLVACTSSSGAVSPGESMAGDAADGGVDGATDGAVDAQDDAAAQVDAALGGEDMASAVDAGVDRGAMDMAAQPARCAAACDHVTDCLIEQCAGFGEGARVQLHARCLDACTPAQAERFADASCVSIAETLSAQQSAVEAACEAPPAEGDGLNTLYIGHSFGRVFASIMPDWARAAGVANHRQQIVMRGGANGAPLALWNDPAAKAEAQAILEGGDIELLVMICCSTTFLEDGTDPGIRAWMDYALARNPNTQFALALPWPDFPESYASAAEYAERWYAGRDAWYALIDQLRADYPGVTIFSILHGRAALELRALFEAGELSDVDSMTSRRGDAIFTDEKGHSNQILRDLGVLVWVGSIYGVDVTGHPLVEAYETDIAGMAQTIVDEDEYTR